MKMCDDCEIVYDEKSCPLCESKEYIKHLEDKIEDLQKEINQ